MVYDKAGNELIKKRFTTESKNWIGITGGAGADKSIELALRTSVEEMFKDRDINRIFKTNYKDFKM